MCLKVMLLKSFLLYEFLFLSKNSFCSACRILLKMFPFKNFCETKETNQLFLVNFRVPINSFVIQSPKILQKVVQKIFDKKHSILKRLKVLVTARLIWRTTPTIRLKPNSPQCHVIKIHLSLQIFVNSQKFFLQRLQNSSQNSKFLLLLKICDNQKQTNFFLSISVSLLILL